MIKIIKGFKELIEGYNDIKLEYSKGLCSDIMLRAIINSRDYLSFEDNSAELIIRNTDNIFSQLENNKNINVYGEVQSGKTDNMIFSIGRALDLNFDLIIFLSGTNNLLKSQNSNRFLSTVSDYYRNSDVVIMEDYDELNLHSLWKQKNKVVMPMLKGSDKLKKLSKIIHSLPAEYSVLVIDDECDYGSANSKGIGMTGRISEITSGNNSKYIGVTATPYPNVLMKNKLSPTSVVPLESHNLYTGLKFFNNEKFWEVSSDANISVKKAIINTVNHFILKGSSATLVICDEVENDKHVETLHNTKKILKELNPSDLFNKTAKDDFKDKLIKLGLNPDISLINFVCAIEKFEINVLNRYNNNFNQEGLQIVIGNILLGRGFTFSNLISEVFLNKYVDLSSTMETWLQRARWFGYRRSVEESIKIYASEEIISFYENIASADEEIRELYIDFKNDENKKNDLIDIITKYKLKVGKK